MAKSQSNASKKINELSKDTRKTIDALQSDIENLFKNFGKLSEQQKQHLAGIISNSKKLQEALKKVNVANVSYKDDLEDVLDLVKDINDSYKVTESISKKLNDLLDKQIGKLDRQKNIKDKISRFDKKTLDTLSKNNILLKGSLNILESNLDQLSKIQAEIALNKNAVIDESVIQQLQQIGFESKQLTAIAQLQNNLKLKSLELEEAIAEQQERINKGLPASNLLQRKILKLKQEQLQAEDDLSLGISRRSATIKKQIQNQKTSLELLDSELKRRERINREFERAKDDIDETYTMYASIASLVPGIGKSLSESFLQAKTISINALERVRDVMYETNDPIQALQAGWSTLTQGLGTFGATLGIVLILLKGVHSLFTAINGTVKSIQSETGLASEESYQLYKNALDAQTSFSNQLSTLEDIVSVQTALVDSYGRYAELSGEVLTQISDVSKVLGYSTDTAGKLQATLMELGADEGLAGNLQVAVGNLAKANKIAPGIIAKDLIDNAEFVAKNFAGMPKQAALTAVEVRKLGYSLQQAAKIQDHLFDIQGSLTAQMEASVALGKLINTNKARQLGLDGDLAGMMREISKEAGTYAEFADMSVPQRMLLARAFGMEVTELQKSLYIQEKLSDLSDKELSDAQRYLKDLENVENMSAGQLKAEISKVQQAEKFDVAMSKIKNALISAILPAAEALVPLMEMLSHIMSGIAVILTPIKLIMMGIAGVVEGMLAPFSFLNDLMSNGLTTAVSNFNEEFLKGWGIAKLIAGSIVGLAFGWKGLFKLIAKGAVAAGKSLMSVFSVDRYKGFFTGMTSRLQGLFSKTPNGPLPAPGGGIPNRSPTPPPSGGSKGASMLGNLGQSIRAIPAKKLLLLGAAFTVFSAGVFVLAKALQQFGSVDLGAMGKAGVALLVLTGVLYGLGVLLTGPQAILFKAGILGLLALGAALAVLGAGMNQVGKAAQKFATALSYISKIDASIIKEVTEVIPDFISSFDGIDTLESPISKLAESFRVMVGSLLVLQDISYDKIAKGLESVAKQPNYTISKIVPGQEVSLEDANSSNFQQRNNALGENATAMNMTRLIQLMEQSVNNPATLVVEFDDGTVSKLKTRIKRTV